ncbi:30S ribosomal protein S7 [Candidatus Woesearchaeota archaeon]|nr:30S ribosomal protein S7 [Candidatus Woesearchaeota archaeon]
MSTQNAEIKVFNKYSADGIKVQDPGLVRYINLEPRIVPKTGGKNIGIRFHKSKTFIVERLINKVMTSGHKSKKHTRTSGHITGKGQTAYNIVEKAFEIIEQKTKKNPVMVLVEAIENAAPREEVIAIEYGGARYPKAVEMAPQRRVDHVLRLFTQSAYSKSFNKPKAIEVALSDEIINAFNMSQNSDAISKKLELERQSDASR